MTYRRRGVLAALFVSSGVAISAALAATAPAFAGPALAPGENVLPNGLTTVSRRVSGSGAVAIEIWIRCPANGWSSTQPGIARLAALTAVAAKSNGTSLREAVRSRGGQLGISIFQTSTEFAILAPGSAASALEDALLRAVFHPSLDAAGFDDARERLAEDQSQASRSAVELLREQAFANVYARGPLHDSPYGDAAMLKSATLNDVRAFIARSYVAGNAAVVAVGNTDIGTRDLQTVLASLGVNAAAAPALPDSPTSGAPGQPVTSSQSVDEAGVALAWAGPGVADHRAATAMDFLSDYLADEHSGVFARAATATSAGSTLVGQFVTLEQPGLFFVSVAGTDVQPLAMARSLRTALQPLIDRPLSSGQFSHALAAYETRLLRQMDSPQGLADNYGWYFVQHAPADAPSATDAGLSGAYFADAASLTPDFIHDIVRRYLGAAPVVIAVQPPKTADATPAGHR